MSFLSRRSRASRGWWSFRRPNFWVCLLVVLCAGGVIAEESGQPSSIATEPSITAEKVKSDKDAAAKQSSKERDEQNLFLASEFPKGWVFYSAEKGAELGATWKVEPAANEQDAVLVCLGKPFGYLRTDQSFENFEFQLEWKYPNDPNANSGILVYTNAPDMIWPEAVQVQLHRPTAGSVFPDGGAKTENTVTVSDLKLPVNEWHKCVITSRDGKISVAINGRKTAEVTGCVPRKGCISIQSEGSEIHFRHLHVRQLTK